MFLWLVSRQLDLTTTNKSPSIASGDIRNIIRAINGLPSNYEGVCTVIVNDIHTHVSSRNLILLTMLLGSPDIDPEEIAETALHLWYSAAVTRDQQAFMKIITSRVVSANTIAPTSTWASGVPVISSTCTLEYHLDCRVLDLAKALAESTYTLQEGREGMQKVTLAPSRIDYRERHLGQLRPRHRTAEMRWKTTGMTLPFGEPLENFTEPNR